MADLRSNLSNPEAVEESLGLLHGSQAGDDGTNIDPAGSENDNQAAQGKDQGDKVVVEAEEEEEEESEAESSVPDDDG